jgi:hypothetical protein
MDYRPSPGRRYYCFPASEKVEGPFELVELAGLLRANHITGETPTLIEGQENWILFQNRPEFQLANEIPPSAIAKHLEEQSQRQGSPFAPRRLLVFLWIMAPVLGYVLYRFGVRYVAYHIGHDAPLDTTGGS